MNFSSQPMDIGDGVAGVSGENADFILVEYPGVVKNVDRALKTLGGIGAIAQATMASGQLELRYQPENLYQSALLADKKVVDEVISGQIRLVVRIRRRVNKKRSSQKRLREAVVDDEKGPIKEVKCLGLVSMVFSFKSMCDFHYLPVRRAREGRSNLYEDLVPRLIPTTFLSALTWFESSGGGGGGGGCSSTPHFLPPSVFSRYTAPSAKMMCSSNEAERQALLAFSGGTDGTTSSSTSAEVVSTPHRRSVGHAKNLRSERKAHTVTVMGGDVFPDAPTETALKDVESRVKLERPYELMALMFAERPLWTRAALLQKTDLEDSVLKVILAKYAFYIVSGPWGRCWCKFGYDPRQDPNAKQFQTIMVSFRDHKNIPERQRLKLSLGGATATPNSVSSRELNQLIDCSYRPGVLPPVRQMWYCVCDVHLPAAQKVMRKDFFAVLKQCHETHGWLPPEIINSIRSSIKQDVQRVSHMLEVNDEYLADGMAGAAHMDVVGGPGGSLASTSTLVTVPGGLAAHLTLDEGLALAYDDDDDAGSTLDWI